MTSFDELHSVPPAAAHRMEEAVCMQRSSPDFPLFCVSHVTDASYRFLFHATASAASDGVSSSTVQAEHAYYVQLLRRAAEMDKRYASPPTQTWRGDPVPTPAGSCAAGAQKRSRAEIESCDTHLSADPAAAAVAAAMKNPLGGVALFAPLYLTTLPPRRRADFLRRHEARAGFFFTLDDTDELWEDLRDAFAARPPAHRGVSRAIGPHAPHPFASRRALQDFVEDVLLAVEAERRELVEDIVTYMLCRLPMTETFVFTIAELIKDILYDAQEELRSMSRAIRSPSRGRQKERGDRNRMRSPLGSMGDPQTDEEGDAPQNDVGLRRRHQSRAGGGGSSPTGTAEANQRPAGRAAKEEQAESGAVSSAAYASSTSDEEEEVLPVESELEGERPLRRLRLEAREQRDQRLSKDFIPPSSPSSPSTAAASAHLSRARKEVEQAGTLLYMITHLLERQRDHEEPLTTLEALEARRLRPVARGPRSGASAPLGGGRNNEEEMDGKEEKTAPLAPETAPAHRVGNAYYGAVFQKYLLALSRRFVRLLPGCAAPQGKQRREKEGEEGGKSMERPRITVPTGGLAAHGILVQSPAFTFLRQLMTMWAADSCWDPVARQTWEQLCRQLDGGAGRD